MPRSSTITRGRYAVDAVVRALADRVHASGIRRRAGQDLGARSDRRPDGGATTTPTHAAHRLAREIGGLVDVRGERLWPTVTVAARRCTDGESTATTLRQVGAALAEAMRAAPGSVQWAVDRDADDAQDRVALVRDLAVALHDDPAQITLAYQPVRDLHSHEQVGAEALLRWTHPQRGPVSAATIVGVAEHNGLVSPLGRVVLDARSRRPRPPATSWPRLPSARQRLAARAARVRVRRQRRRRARPAPAASLDAAAGDHRDRADDERADVLPVVAALRDPGVEIGIDDFGTGYSSIGRLQQMPIDTVKIDQSLIAEIATSPEQFDLVRAVLRMVRTTDARVVAEGVETAVQVAHLRALGCTLGQGYFLGDPAPWSTIGRAS